MKNLTRSSFAILCCVAAITFTSCSNDDDDITDGGDSDPVVAGYIYTTTNGQGENQVIRFERMDDGSLRNETAFPTGSNGGANISVGGDAFGDYDSQGAIRIIGDYFLTVNSGGNTVSVFSLDKTNGNLTRVANTNSGGTRPVSITSTPVSGSTTEFWVVVGNQWNNPNVQGSGADLRRFPNDAFHMMDLTQPDATDQERNIQLFRFNTTNGSLTSVSQLDNYVRENGGPVNVTFSEDGSKLAVSLWGVAHFGTDSPSLEEQRPSRVYVYDFNNGTASNGRFFQEEGIAGTIGIDWARGSNSLLYSTNFNTTIAKTNNSLTVLLDNGSSVTKSGNFATSTADDLDEACWTAVSPSGDRLYVASFGSNVITPFALGASGNVTSTLPVEAREGNAPPADSKDVWVTPNNQYLYHLGAFQSFSMNIFDITQSGVDYREQIVLQTTQSGLGQPGAFNFLGLTGFDL
ncbi:hypothetical protein [Rasiella sp. SM2506]|uniref:hypothetical protein n=1 Tax=Rasiella sp. SM2506 TaxID=3423914 RepID=UPI003D7B357B